MRVLFVCPDMGPGGAERHWAQVIPALARRGHRAALLTLAGEGELLDQVRAAGVPSLCAGMRRRLDPAGLRRALRFARGRADVVVSRAVSAELVGQLIARRERARHVVNEHTPVTLGGELLPLRPHQRRLRRLYAGRVDGVVAVTAAQLEPLARAGFPRERIAVVANGVEAPPEPVPPPPEGFVALMAAGLRPEKRADVFVRAVAEAPGVSGLIAGEGRERGRIERLIAATGARVELLGQRDDVAGLLVRSHAAVLPSEAEALPLSVLEAMAAGRPVLATAVGGVPEAVSDGESGRLLPAGDHGALAAALREMAADPGSAARMGAAGHRRVRERFSPERMVAGYEAALS